MSTLNESKAALVKRGLPAEAVAILAAQLPAGDLSYKPKKVIKSTTGQGFVALAIAYVDRDAVCKRLHESGLAWSYKPTLIERTNVYACILGTILVTLESGVVVEFSDYGEAENGRGYADRELVKEANTDAIKRAGRMLLIGAEMSKVKKVWKPCLVENERDTKLKFQAWVEEVDPEPPAIPPVTKPITPAVVAVINTKPPPPHVERIEKLIEKHAIKRSELILYIQNTFKVNDFALLTEANAQVVVDTIVRKYESPKEVPIGRS